MVGYCDYARRNSCYVTDSWDQKIWASPSAKAKFRKLAKLGTKDFTVRDSNWNGDELWLQVEFSEEVNCDWKELPPVLAKGWMLVRILEEAGERIPKRNYVDVIRTRVPKT